MSSDITKLDSLIHYWLDEHADNVISVHNAFTDRQGNEHCEEIRFSRSVDGIFGQKSHSVGFCFLTSRLSNDHFIALSECKDEKIANWAKKKVKPIKAKKMAFEDVLKFIHDFDPEHRINADDVDVIHFLNPDGITVLKSFRRSMFTKDQLITLTKQRRPEIMCWAIFGMSWKDLAGEFVIARKMLHVVLQENQDLKIEICLLKAGPAGIMKDDLQYAVDHYEPFGELPVLKPVVVKKTSEEIEAMVASYQFAVYDEKNRVIEVWKDGLFLGEPELISID